MSGFAGAMFVEAGALLAPSHKTETTYVLSGVGATLSIAGAIWTLIQHQWAYTTPFVLSLVGVAIALYVKHSASAKVAKNKLSFDTESGSALPRAAVSVASKPETKERSARSKASEETVFHRFIQLSQNNLGPDLNSVLVTAEVWVKAETNGSRKYGSRLYPCADSFSVIETQSIIYWKQCLDESNVSTKQARRWLQSLAEAGSQIYFRPRDDQPEAVNDMMLQVGLTAASLHYAITNMEQLEYPESLKKWLRAGIAKGDGFSRSGDVNGARLLKNALSDHAIDPIFITHLVKSVGGR